MCSLSTIPQNWPPRISFTLPPGTSASGRKLLLRQAHHIYKALSIFPTEKLSPLYANSCLGLISNLPGGPFLSVSIIVVKMGTSMSMVNDHMIPSTSAIRNVADGLKLLNPPVQEILTRSTHKFYCATMGPSIEFETIVSLSPLPYRLPPVLGSSDLPDVENPGDVERNIPDCTPNHLTSGGMDTSSSQSSLLTTSTIPTPLGLEGSLRSGPTTMVLSPRQKENLCRSDQRDYWSLLNTQLLNSSPSTNRWLKRSRDVFESSNAYPVSPLNGKKPKGSKSPEFGLGF